MKIRRKTILIALIGVTIGFWGAGCPKKSGSTAPQTQETGEDDSSSDTTAISPQKIEEAQRVLVAGRNHIELCYQNTMSRRKDKSYKGEVIVGVTIGLSRTPHKVWIFKIDDSLKDDRFVQCVKETVAKWEFPILGKKIDLTSPRYFLDAY